MSSGACDRWFFKFVYIYRLVILYTYYPNSIKLRQRVNQTGLKMDAYAGRTIWLPTVELRTMSRTSTIVMLVGVVMLFLPEPITSGLGLLVILAGLAMRLLSSA